MTAPVATPRPLPAADPRLVVWAGLVVSVVAGGVLGAGAGWCLVRWLEK